MVVKEMPIEADIRKLIKKQGHLKIDELMREVTSVHKESYYKHTKNLGAGGDFITSPEVSQLFGETLALWAIEKWQQIGKPEKFALLELGPGQGKLMNDLLRTAKIMPSFYKAVSVYLYDVNPHFIKKQEDILAKHNKKITWIENLAMLPGMPTIVIANEFFDALPIKQYKKTKNTWHEVTVKVNPSDQKLRYNKTSLSAALGTQLKADHINAKDGAYVEESIESMKTVRTICKHLKKNKGCCLFVDYGYNIEPDLRTSEQYRSTLQAIKDHKYADILNTLGEADLSAHVDFKALKKAAKQHGVKKGSYSMQKDFLAKYGINLRLSMLKNNASERVAKILDRQYFRLTSEKQMGKIFKVLELVKI